MNKHLLLVREFHTAFKYPQAQHGTTEQSLLTPRWVDLRQGLLLEELSEIQKAWAAGDHVGVIDGYIDEAYFALGTLAAMGENVRVNGRESLAGTWGTRPQLKESLQTAVFLAVRDLGKPLDDLMNAGVAAISLSDVYWRCVTHINRYFGYDFDTLFTEVHRSNMSKLGEDGKPVLSASGKILKGPNYSPPDLGAIIEEFDSV